MSKYLTKEELLDSVSRPERHKILCGDAWRSFEHFLDADHALRRLLVRRDEAIAQGSISRMLNSSLNNAQKEVKAARQQLTLAMRQVGGRLDPELFLDDPVVLDGGFWISQRLNDRGFQRYCRSARRHAYKDDWSVDKLGHIWEDYQKYAERKQEAERKRKGLPPEGMDQLSFNLDEE